MNSQRKIRVLIVDDSAVIRKMFSSILNETDDIEVVATAVDPYSARNKLVQLKPDVMILDIEMPKMDGITFLKKVMKFFPVKTLIVSSLVTENSELTKQALAAGAIAVLDKSFQQSNVTTGGVDKLANEVRLAFHHQWTKIRKTRNMKFSISKSLPKQTGDQVLAIASSTGGVEALKIILKQLPADIPGTVIVQHMPPGFTTSFANQLNEICPFQVREAKSGDRLQTGLALLVPGNYHLLVFKKGGSYYVQLDNGPLVNGVRPAADITFCTIARHVGSNAIGLVLTGMGKDGAKGLAAMHAAGSINFAQDEATSTVFGMPKAAINAGAIHKILPLDSIPSALIREFNCHQFSESG